MRLPKEATIDAGLLRYANMVVDHDVFNHFKSMIKTDDISYVVLDVKSDPDSASFEKVYVENDETDSNKTQVFIDHNASNQFHESELRNDVYALINKANLSEIEKEIIKIVDLQETSISDVSARMSMSPARINRIRTNALSKLRELV